MVKPLILTAHAQVRMQERQIRRQWVEDAARAPDWIEPDPKDASVERRFRAVHQYGGRILRVACVETDSTIRVISMMFDRDARRPP